MTNIDAVLLVGFVWSEMECVVTACCRSHMANPLLDTPLLLGHSARITPDPGEHEAYLKFAKLVTDRGEDDIESIRVKARKFRVVDTSGNAPYDETRQQQRLNYVAALDLMRKLGLTKNQHPFVYTPIHFRNVRLKDSDRVRVFEYWRDQCYTLYSYCIHEYRAAASMWSRQARDCVNDSCNMELGSHLREFYPAMTEDGLLAIAAMVNRARVALGECRSLYLKKIEDGARDLTVLAQCGDMGYIKSLSKYLDAFVHEIIVVASEFKVDDPCDIAEDMDLHAQYAQCVAENYAELEASDPTWFPPDRQVSYQSRMGLRASTWKCFAQILAARHELSVLQIYVNPKTREERAMKANLVKRLGDDSMSLIHQPIELLQTEVDVIEDSILATENDQPLYSPDETALRLYISVMALKLIDTYHLYTNVFDKKPLRPVTPYAISANPFEFTRCTPASFAGEIDTMRNDIVLSSGSISYVLSAAENRSYISSLSFLPSRSSVGAKSGDLLGVDTTRHDAYRSALREKQLENRTAIGDVISSVSSFAVPVEPTVAYQFGVTEERIHWMRDLKRAHAMGMTLADVVDRFDGENLSSTCECYDMACDFLDMS